MVGKAQRGVLTPDYFEPCNFPSLPNPGIELGFPALQADSLPAKLPGKPVLVSNIPFIGSK